MQTSPGGESPVGSALLPNSTARRPEPAEDGWIRHDGRRISATSLCSSRTTSAISWHLCRLSARLASSTERLRLGCLVFNNGIRHPVVLAREIATLDLLSEGRVEAALGAGWLRADYDESGIAYDAPAVRVDRFEEAVVLMDAAPRNGRSRLLQREALPGQRPPPHAASGAASPPAAHHRRRWQAACAFNRRPPCRHCVDQSQSAVGRAGPVVERQRGGHPPKIAWVADAAGDRFADIELNCYVGHAQVTEDRGRVLESLASEIAMPPREIEHSPLVLAGTFGQMEEELDGAAASTGSPTSRSASTRGKPLVPSASKLAGT